MILCAICVDFWFVEILRPIYGDILRFSVWNYLQRPRFHALFVTIMWDFRVGIATLTAWSLEKVEMGAGGTCTNRTQSHSARRGNLLSVRMRRQNTNVWEINRYRTQNLDDSNSEHEEFSWKGGRFVARLRRLALWDLVRLVHVPPPSFRVLSSTFPNWNQNQQK